MARNADVSCSSENPNEIIEILYRPRSEKGKELIYKVDSILAGLSEEQVRRRKCIVVDMDMTSLSQTLLLESKMTTEEKVDLIRQLTHATIRSQNTEKIMESLIEWQLEFVRNQMKTLFSRTTKLIFYRIN